MTETPTDRIADWVDAQTETDRSKLKQRVEALADRTGMIQADGHRAAIGLFQPFPTKALPQPIRRFVEAGAKAIGCDTSYLALPMLTVLGAAIGNTRRVELKRGWTAPPIIWTAIVGESGTAKSPAFKLVMRPIRERQRKATDAHAEELKQHEADLAHYEKALAKWKRDSKTQESPPIKPSPPDAARYLVSDTTVEALAPLLRANPRGLLLARDELSGWFGSFDRYAAAKGADESHWLSLHNGDSIVVDRKTGNPRTICVDQPSVSITGGIQPAVLHRALGREHRESGLAARLLLTCPPRKLKQWTEADINPEAEVELTGLINRLYDLQPTVDDDGRPSPAIVGLTPDARELWKDYYNKHAEEQVDLSSELSAAWSKLEEYAARLALVIHCSKRAADELTSDNEAVDAESMRDAIEMVHWFKAEVRRVYSLLSESEKDREHRQLIDWIDRKGGNVTARELQQGNRRFTSADDATAAIDELAKAGHGSWQSTPSGQRGRPTRRFVLSSPPTVYVNPTNPGENDITVDVDKVSAQHQTQLDEEWGEL